MYPNYPKTDYPESVRRAFASAVSARRSWRARDKDLDTLLMLGVTGAALAQSVADSEFAHTCYMGATNALLRAIDDANLSLLLPQFVRCVKASADGPSVRYIMPGDSAK